MIFRPIIVCALLLTLLMAACSSTSTPAIPAESTVPAAAVETEAVVTPETETPEETATEAVEATAEPAEEITTTATVTTEVAASATTGCLEPDADTQLLSSPAAGYCFLIPATFARSPFSDTEGFNIGIYGPESTPGHRERAFVNVTEATTATLEAGVQAVISDVLASLPGFTPTQSTLTLGGLPAIQLDNVPGQDLNRKVYAIYEGHLYELAFVPLDTDRADAHAEMEELYALMIDSFRFMTPTTATSSYAPLLSWEGEIDGACHTLIIQPSGEAAVSVCGDEPVITTTLTGNAEWAAIQQQFGDINAETPAGTVIFQGQGSASGDLWSQALATWASFTAMEINAGRPSASARTVLAWKVTDSAEHSGQCSHLVVLAYGYAYANLIPCEGNGESTQVAAGWLTDTELDSLYEWTANGTRVEDEAGYLDAQGSTPVTPEEIGTWAKAVYARMIQ